MIKVWPLASDGIGGRLSPFVAQMQASIGLTDERLDELFDAAKKILGWHLQVSQSVIQGKTV